MPAESYGSGEATGLRRKYYIGSLIVGVLVVVAAVAAGRPVPQSLDSLSVCLALFAISRSEGRGSTPASRRSSGSAKVTPVNMGARSSTLACLVAATVALAGATLAEAAPATLHLTADVYDVHESKDLVSSKEKLHQGTSYVGEDYSRCQLSKSSAHCVGSYTLRHGTITFSGTISNTSKTNRLTITGGTGIYKGVRGSVLTEYNKAGTKAKEALTF